MVHNLEKAFAEASKLSEQEQEALASWILDELASERRWADTFADSKDALSKLADEALEDHRQGRTENLSSDGI